MPQQPTSVRHQGETVVQRIIKSAKCLLFLINSELIFNPPASTPLCECEISLLSKWWETTTQSREYGIFPVCGALGPVLAPRRDLMRWHAVVSFLQNKLAHTVVSTRNPAVQPLGFWVWTYSLTMAVIWNENICSSFQLLYIWFYGLKTTFVNIL